MVRYSQDQKVARGRSNKDKSCRRGCGGVETFDNILQKCYATHKFRKNIHDNVVKYLARIFQDRGHTVHREQTFEVQGRTYKPDLVVYSTARVYSVDVQVITDQYSLNDAYENKSNKYKVLRTHLDRLRLEGFYSGSLTANWKGVISGACVKDLIAFGLLRYSDLKVLSMKVLLGGVITHSGFQRMTVSPRSLKKGEG